MKTKDMIGLVFAVVLLAVVGFIFYQSQAPKKAATAKTASLQAEVVPTINSQLDPNNTVTAMSSTYLVHDYKQPVDLNSGVGVTSLFGQ